MEKQISLPPETRNGTSPPRTPSAGDTTEAADVEGKWLIVWQIGSEIWWETYTNSVEARGLFNGALIDPDCTVYITKVLGYRLAKARKL